MKKRSVFVDYFGESPTIKVIDFFIENDLYDYSKTDIHKHTGIARTTLQNIIDELIKKKIIVKTRSVGRANMYMLNKKNPTVKHLINFAINLAISFAREKTPKPVKA